MGSNSLKDQFGEHNDTQISVITLDKLLLFISLSPDVSFALNAINSPYKRLIYCIVQIDIDTHVEISDTYMLNGRNKVELRFAYMHNT